MFCAVTVVRYQLAESQKYNGKIISLDLDVVITGSLDRIFDRNESFVILCGANAENPCPYNGSVFMFDSGTHCNLWTEFSLAKAQTIPYYDFPDDQGWFWHMLPNAATWPCGSSYRHLCIPETGMAWIIAARCKNGRVSRLAIAEAIQASAVDQRQLEMIDKEKVALFIPPGLKKFKLDLFETIGKRIGKVVRHDPRLWMNSRPTPSQLLDALRHLDRSSKSGKQRTDFIYWDRGYLRRVFATWLPRGSEMGIRGGYYRWHLNCFQMQQIYDVPDDRWQFLQIECIQ